MSLSSYRVGAAIAVSDMNRAKEFYEGKLGFTAAGDDPDGGRSYECAEQTTLHVFPSPAAAGASGATVAGWTVDDLEQVVDELTANGVTFERYDDEQISTDEKGIAVFGDSKSAWFKDPDGNVLALVQP
jgi:catechol 2,3-dioxygenase-like lactoylglutathione lyase family enzyme